MSRTSVTPLYKFVTVEGLWRILHGSIRFTQPSAFNDPFELLPAFVMQIGLPEKPNEEMLEIRFDINAKRRNPPVGEMHTVPDGSIAFDPTARDIVAALNREIGFFCLSTNSDSLLMWSHYADQYAGAVVEFDSTHDFFAHPIEIEYRSTRPQKNISFLRMDEPIPVSELCNKSIEWIYEQEVRIVRCLRDCVDSGHTDPKGFRIFSQKIPVEAVKSVILGERMPYETMREIYEYLKETNISLDLAAVDMTNYSFRREKIKSAVPSSEMYPWLTPRTANIFKTDTTALGDIARALLESHPMSRIVNKPV